MYALVLDNEKKALMPCHPARARELLTKRRAAIYRRYPFTIILKERMCDNAGQPIELKIDPGSKKTGIALVAHGAEGRKVIWAADLRHRGEAIRKSLTSRRAIRRSRRTRKTRYRAPRFDNRTRPKGWLPPSLMSRVGNVRTWAKRLLEFAPITSIVVETVRFDTQLLKNPEISGIEYQQGTLYGYELREYLLEKWGRKCAYCGKKNIPLQIEHIVPRSRGGSNRVGNLTLSCEPCNIKKGNRTALEFGHPRIQKQAGLPLKDAAAVNATRYAIGNMLKTFGLPVTFFTGGRTKFNRTRQGYPKEHWIDAACVGETGCKVRIPLSLNAMSIGAAGRGSRQTCNMNRFGFPRTGAKKEKRVLGFQTGDLVRAIVPKGKKTGTYVGRVAVRSTGSFNVQVPRNGTVQGISFRYCKIIQRGDGYVYSIGKNEKGGRHSSQPLKRGGSPAANL